MAEDSPFSVKEILVPKQSSLMLRLVVLVFAMVCGIYICFICLKQFSIGNTAFFMNVQVNERPCPKPDIEEWEVPYVHYPKPVTYSREECACHPVRYFAILSTQRSGSGWFETLLNSHMNVSSNGEIFSVKVRRANASTIIENLDKLYNLDWFSSASKNECTAAVGLKWMLNQGLMQNHEQILEYFKAKGVSVIFLFRRNLLRRMISILANTYDRDFKLLNGTHKSHVHSPREAEILASYKPVINTTKLIHELKQVQKTMTKALGVFNSTRHIVLYYEDVLKNRTKLLDVEDFLRVPRRNLTSRQVKIHKGSFSDHVANWDDVQRTLNHTEFESFLHADYRL
uniref:Sulfotransferase n=1 Tax=Opuntia streptacantha TaxID=393608 RepID=A0A7C8ZG36_OPUST